MKNPVKYDQTFQSPTIHSAVFNPRFKKTSLTTDIQFPKYNIEQYESNCQYTIVHVTAHQFDEFAPKVPKTKLNMESSKLSEEKQQ